MPWHPYFSWNIPGHAELAHHINSRTRDRPQWTCPSICPSLSCLLLNYSTRSLSRSFFQRVLLVYHFYLFRKYFWPVSNSNKLFKCWYCANTTVLNNQTVILNNLTHWPSRDHKLQPYWRYFPSFKNFVRLKVKSGQFNYDIIIVSKIRVLRSFEVVQRVW